MLSSEFFEMYLLNCILEKEFYNLKKKKNIYNKIPQTIQIVCDMNKMLTIPPFKVYVHLCRAFSHMHNVPLL